MHFYGTECKCTKCGHVEHIGNDDQHWTKSPITSEGRTICPVCWNEFLNTFGAVMLCTSDFGLGAEYDNYKNATAVTAEKVTRLRDETDMPMMYCKRALVQAFGDHDKAKEMIRTGRVRG